MKDKELIEFISKINDRTLHKKQISGFTLWAILGVLSYLILDLCDKVPQIYVSEELKAITLVITTGVLNFSYFFIVLISSTLAFFPLNTKRKFYTRNNLEFLFLYTIVVILIQLVIIIFNIKVSNLYFISAYELDIFTKSIPYKSLFFYIAAFYLGMTIEDVYTNIFKYLRKIKLGNKAYLKLTYNYELKKARFIADFLFSIIMFFLLYAIYTKIDFPLSPTDESLILKISFDITGILVLIPILLHHRLFEIQQNWLENLEMDIYFNNLTADEIIEKIEKEYIGTNLLKWFSNNIQQFDSRYSEIVSIMKYLNDIKHKNVNIDVPIPKTKEQKEEIKNNLATDFSYKYNSYLSDVEDFMFDVLEIFNQGPLEKNEESEIMSGIKKLHNDSINLVDQKKKLFE